jgi:hypothetical protein
MGALVLACEKDAGHAQSPALADRDDVELRRVPARPGKDEVDPLLKGLDGRRLVVIGTDADLAAVALRLLRADRLRDVTVGYVPAEADSTVASLWDLPLDGGRAIDVALTGEVDPVPLIRDDSGGVLVGRGVIGPIRGMAYCDESVVLRGQASRITVSPDPDRGAGLLVQVTKRTLVVKRTAASRGRACQIGCVPAVVQLDGVPHPRPVTKWTWYRNSDDLRLARGLL